MSVLNCRVCGEVSEPEGEANLMASCPACGASVTLTRGRWYAETGQQIHVPRGWKKPKTIYALPLGHPDRVVSSPDQALRVLEREGMVVHPADESGVRHERTTFSGKEAPKFNSEPAGERVKAASKYMRRRKR